jgi:type IV pilus assembly protein PilY1
MYNPERRSSLQGAGALLLALLGAAGQLAAAPSQEPLFLQQQAHPNVLLNLSVESPMGGAAYNDQPGDGCAGRASVSGAEYGTCYSPARDYLGYFDPYKCYVYRNGRFEPSGATSADHGCSGKWSGNLLNWAGMTAIDMLIMTMTGGNRIVDTTGETVVRRARKTQVDAWFPYKLLRSDLNVAPSTVTPFTDATLILFNTAFGLRVGTTRSGAAESPTTYELSVKVCDAEAGLEANCVAYGEDPVHYKPEGLIHENAEAMRFAVTSYLLDGANTRDGGVLRSNAKYVGPRSYDYSANEWVENPSPEWDTDGLLTHNPEAVGSGLNSGVINYLNKFSDFGYKGGDPASELFYESLRYLKGLGPTPEYSAGVTRSSADTRCGGFWFANDASEWEDPVRLRCQRSFVIGINDANPWLDKRLPGTWFTADKTLSFSPPRAVKRCNNSTVSISQLWKTGSGPCANADLLTQTTNAADCAAREAIINRCQVTGADFGEPGDADADIDVTAWTNAVGEFEGLHTDWPATGTWVSLGANGTVSGANDSVGGSVGEDGNYSNDCSAKPVSALGQVMGTCGAPQKQNSYYIAGLAYYANTTDLRADFTGSQSVSTFFIDSQEYAGNPLDGPRNMLWLAGKYGGFRDADGSLTPNLQSEWDADGDGQPDNYVLATRPESLVEGLESAFRDIEDRTSSAAAVVASSGRVASETRLFLATFNTANWTGELQAREYSQDEEGVWSVDVLPAWTTSDEDSFPEPAARRIFTWNPTLPDDGEGAEEGAEGMAGAEFQLAGEGVERPLTAGQASSLNTAGLDADNAADVLAWLRGDRSGEDDGGFRVREALLGDVINSSPVHVKAADFGHERLPDADGGGEVYREFRVANRDRDGMVYVGANDGMLHGFDAESGVERFAFVPNAAFAAGLASLSSPGYGHRALVDGPLAYGDAYVADAWRTVLIGSMGAGGKSVFALDVTDPDALDADDGYTRVMWEFDASVSGSLGHLLQRPTVVRMRNGRWAAVFGNGFSSNASHAGVFIVYLDPDLADGWTEDDDFQWLPTDNMTGNGMSEVSVLADAQGTAVAIYAGDLRGRVWKFDVSDEDPAEWGAAFAEGGVNQPLFSATDPDGDAQPITVAIEIGVHPRGGHMLYFGTGRFFEDGDQADLQVQSVYGVWDKPDAPRIEYDDRGEQLGELDIVLEDAEEGVRVVSESPTDLYVGSEPMRGWFLDLAVGGGALGERVSVMPRLIDRRLLVTSLVPSADPCAGGGYSWLMLLDALNGGRLVTNDFDRDDDGDFDDDDGIVTADGQQIVTGIRQQGIVPGVAILSKGDMLSLEGNSSEDGALFTRNVAASQRPPRSSWRELLP